MKFVYSPRYEADIGAHVFPTSKYRLVREKLLGEALVTDDAFLAPEPPSREELLRAHTTEFIDDLIHLRWTHRTSSSELPISAQIVHAYLLAAGGTILAARQALATPRHGCVHIGGGFHHAFADHAEGFCYINDIAVAIEAMRHEKRISRALVVDCDLHQGNGTAHIYEQDNDVFTISMHQENNYPAKQRSDIDVGLRDHASDHEYLQALREVYPSAVESHKPDLIVYVAGADPYEYDQLGGLKLTLAGLSVRDETVIGEAAKRQIPFIVVLAGGYARKLEDTVEIHTETCRVALRLTAGR